MAYINMSNTMGNMMNMKGVFNNKDCVNIFKRKFKNNLFAVISIGSLTTEHYQKGWSDIDLLIVLNNLSLSEKVQIANIKIDFENEYGCRFGINVIEAKDAIQPLKPEIFLDGKTLQGLLELSMHPERLIYCSSIRSTGFFVPNKELVRKYSLSNIAMFLLRNRKVLTSSIFSDVMKIKLITEKEVRAAFIITMLAIQYRSNVTSNGHIDTIINAEKFFPDFDFSTLKYNEIDIGNWNNINSKKCLFKILRRTDAYIELFSKYLAQNN